MRIYGKGVGGQLVKVSPNECKNNGITQEKMAETITHAAFYAGWPNAWAVFNTAKAVYADDDAEKAHDGLFGLGGPNTAFAQYCTGNSYLKPPADPSGALFLANVTFEPGYRSNWHKHCA